MRTVVLVTFALFLAVSQANAQRYAVANGDWNDPIWASTSVGTPGTASTPTSSDDVFTNGFNVTVSSSVVCKNLNIRANVASSLDIGDNVVTIYGLLTGVDGAGTAAFPSLADVLVMGEFGELILIGTGQKINRWRYTNPLTNVTFDPGSSGSASINSGFRVDNFGIIRVASGTLNISSSTQREIRGCSDCTLIIANGASIVTGAAINGPSTATDGTERTTSFGTINIEGSLTTTTYVNADNFSLGVSGTFSTSFSGATQTEGWWYQSQRPTGGAINSTSTITYNSLIAQNIYPRQYGNLTLNGGSGVSKSVSGSGSLNIQGNLTFVNSGLTFSSPVPVVFNGTAAQSISGGAIGNFNGGLQVNKSAGSLTLAQNISVQTGITVSQGALDASNYAITLAGNINNSGAISFGTGATLGTLIVDGSVTASGSVPSFGHITVNPSGSFSNAGAINVAGNIANNGTFSVSGINFNGTSAQSISGALSLSNITVSNASGVANNGSVDVTGTVSLSGSGTFDADGSGSGVLTLKSTGLTSTARIATLPNPSLFSGDVTVERFINAPEDWRYLSIPITNGNVGMWQDDFPVTGNFSDASAGGNVVNSASPSIYSYDPSNLQWVAVGSGGSVASTSLSNATGYSVWSYLSANVSVDVTGQIAKGQRSISIRSGDNLIPNPYPSAIDWDNVNLSGANLNTNALYVRTGNGTYASYTQGGGVGTGHPLGGSWGGEVALGQSFWVSGAGNGTLNFQEDDKTSSTYFVREASPSNVLRIKLHKDQKSDDVVVYFNENATLAKDMQFDAVKKLNDIALNLSTFNEDASVDYSINGVPPIQCTYTTGIKLGSTNPEGSYSFSFEDLSGMKLGYKIILRDKFLNVEKQVTEGMTYAFNITNDPASTGAARFEVTFSSPEIEVHRDLGLVSTFQCANAMVKVEIANSQPGIQYLFKLGDTDLHEAVRGDGGNVIAWINKSSLAFGLNKLSLVASSVDGCNAHIFNEALAVRFDPVYEIDHVVPGKSCGDGPISVAASGAPLDGSYLWYDAIDAVEPIAGFTGQTFETPVLTESHTYYVTALNASGCESIVKVPVEARVTHILTPEIFVEGNILTVDQKSGLQWFKDGVAIAGATASTFEVKESGVYSCTFSKDGCSVSSEGRTFIINSIEEVSSQYRIYPNPVTEYMVVKGVSGDETIELFDSKGRRVVDVQAKGITFERQGEVSLDMRTLKNGLYLMNVLKGNQIYQVKVMKK